MGLEPRLVDIGSFGNGAWHLVFHYFAEAESADPVAVTGNVAEAEWFLLDALPRAAEVAHHG